MFKEEEENFNMAYKASSQSKVIVAVTSNRRSFFVNFAKKNTSLLFLKHARLASKLGCVSCKDKVNICGAS